MTKIQKAWKFRRGIWCRYLQVPGGRTWILPPARVGGVYQIVNMETGGTYIGSSHNVYKRFAAHQHDLKANRHRCRSLQEEFNATGMGAYRFEVLEVVEDDEKRFAREYEWIEHVSGRIRLHNQAGVPEDYRGKWRLASRR